MRSWSGIAVRTATGVISLLALGASASAQATNNATNNDWRYSITPYVWFTGLTGRVGVRQVSSSVDLSPGDVLDMLNFGIMGTGDARKGPWVLGFDGIYAALGSGRAFAIRGDTGSLDLSQHETIIQPYGGYTIAGQGWSVDLLAGLRYWNLSTTLDVDRTRRPSNERSGSRSWVDATGGFRAQFEAMDKLRVRLGGDGGGGGSRGSWQAYGTLGYQAWTHWNIGLGYRSLWVNYDHDNFLYDTTSSGMLLGATYSFK